MENIMTAFVTLVIGARSLSPSLEVNSRVDGYWLSEDRDAAIEVQSDGEELQGKIVWLADPLDAEGKPQRDLANPDDHLRGREIVSMTLMWGFKRSSGKSESWKGGRIYDPNNGKTYKSKLELADNNTVLKIRGYVGISLLGRTTEWTRLSSEMLEKLRADGIGTLSASQCKTLSK